MATVLALTRKVGEAITIGPDIRVVVLHVKGGIVRLGIDAPRSVAVHRDEVYSRIREQNRLAFGARFFDRFVAPRPPIDGVFGVLAQIRRGFIRDPIRHICYW